MVTIRRGYCCVTSDANPTVANSWVTHVEHKFGMDWVTCDRTDFRFAKFVGKSFEMMEELWGQTNRRVIEHGAKLMPNRL